MTVEVLERDERYVVAVWRRMMLLVWLGQIRAAGIDRSQALFRAWAPNQPGGAVLFVVVPRQPPGPPDEDTHAAMARATQDPPPELRGMGTLLEAHGFIAATVRSIISRVYRRHARGVAANVFCDADVAARWASERLGDAGIRAESLEEAIRAARAAG